MVVLKREDLVPSNLNIERTIIMNSFPVISAEKFAEFHASFYGEGNWWKICKDCGGKCEENKIGSLMPGEKEFIARTRNRYIPEHTDTIETPFGAVEVLELKPGCPFLFNLYCSLDREKVVLCEIYPIIFKVLTTRIRFFLDSECPLCRNPQAVKYFKKVGIPALEKLGAPLLWWRAVAMFDSYDFDYKILAKLPRINGRGVFRLEQILTARKVKKRR
jgi:uncharacterized protein